MFGYSIYDKKAGMYHPPMFMQHDVQAVRAVEQSAQDGKSQLAKYPGDFALVCVCEFLENDGTVIPIDQRIVAQVASLVGGAS